MSDFTASMAKPRILCALLAAGEAKRFGGGKLEALLNGVMLGTHAAQALIGADIGDRIAVTHPDTQALRGWLAQRSFTVIINDKPARGLSSSLALAAKAAQAGNYDGMLLCLADMPFVTPDHLQALAHKFSGRNIVSLCGGRRMPPALFARDSFTALMTLTGESGGRDLLAGADTVSADPNASLDIDTRAQLSDAQAPTGSKYI